MGVAILLVLGVFGGRTRREDMIIARGLKVSECSSAPTLINTCSFLRSKSGAISLLSLDYIPSHILLKALMDSQRAQFLHTTSWHVQQMASLMPTSLDKVDLVMSIEDFFPMVRRWPSNGSRPEVVRGNVNFKLKWR